LIESADIRRWLKVSFGLQDRVKASDLGKEFTQQFFKAAQNCMDSLSISLLPPSSQLGQHARIFYSTPKTRKAAMIDLFTKNPMFAEPILSCFASLWNSYLLDKVIHQACLAIQSGQSVLSILDILRSSLEFLLHTVTGTSIVMMTKNLGWDTIQKILRSGATERNLLEEVFALVIQMTDYSQDISDETLLIVHEFNLPMVTHQYPSASELPLYDAISKRLSAIWAKVLQTTPKEMFVNSKVTSLL
jgi:hypothetical protein